MTVDGRHPAQLLVTENRIVAHEHEDLLVVTGLGEAWVCSNTFHERIARDLTEIDRVH